MIEQIGGGFEKTLLMAADKLRKNIGPAFKNNDYLKTNTALRMPALECLSYFTR
jgi:hypothetical protein